MELRERSARRLFDAGLLRPCLGSRIRSQRVSSNGVCALVVSRLTPRVHGLQSLFEFGPFGGGTRGFAAPFWW